MSDSKQVREQNASHDSSVMAAVRSNTDLLHELVAQLTEVQQSVDAAADGREAPSRPPNPDTHSEIGRLKQIIARLETQNSELHSQNEALAAKIANAKIQEKTPDNSLEAGEMLSWEERKRLILLQMEEDSFDANQFAASLSSEIKSGKETPGAFIDRLRLEIEQRDDEIAELRNLLDQQAEARSDGTAIGASAIADMLDTDELISHEREKLQRLQAEWEEKFREGEIEASLERAKLSRERQEVSAKKHELELQLEQLQREYRQTNAAGGGSSRRWLAKLGLAEDDS